MLRLVLAIWLVGITLAMPTRAVAAEGGEVREVRAPNGLRIITKEAFAKDLVALNIYVDGGNRTEPARLSGLSHYYEHLIFRGGTRKQAELETRRAFESLGEFNGWTSSDVTCYGFVVPAARFDEALDRFVDAVMNVDVTAEKVAKEREVVLSEFKMSYADSPRGWSWYNLMHAAFRVHPYGRTTIGLREVIEGAELERFRTFYAERYVPNHIVVAVVGAIPHGVAAEKVARAWAGYTAGKPSFETGDVEPPQEAPRAVVEAKKTEKSYAAVGFRAPAVRAEDAHAVAVLAQVLGGGDGSRLEREVRARKGLVLSAGAWFDETKDPGLLGISYTCEPGKETGALAAIAEEAARLKAVEVPPEELARAKTAIVTADLFASESYAQQANKLCWYAVIGDPALGADHAARVRAVTAGEVREVARRYLRASGGTASLVIPEPGTGTATPAPTADGLIATLRGVDGAGVTATTAAPTRATQTLARALDGGAVAIAREDRSAPIVSASFRFASPLELEPRERPGVAALAERLLVRGTKDLTRAEFAGKLDELGVHFSTSLGLDALTATLEAPAERFEAALDLAAGALLAPAFAPDELEKARAEQVAAIEAVEDDSFGLVGREFYRLLYGDGPYGRPTEGMIEGVRAASRADVESWHAAATRPARLVIAVVGSIDPEAAIAAVERRFCAGSRASPPGAATCDTTGSSRTLLTDTGCPAPATPTAAPAPGAAFAGNANGPTAGGRAKAHRELLLDRAREQVCFRMGHVGVAPSDPDWVPLAIAVRHLASQVFFRYVYENGMAYRAWTYLRGGARAHPFTFEMGVSAPNFRKAREGLTEALRDLVAKGLGPEEVARAKAELVSRHLLAQQTDAEQAGLLAYYEGIGLGWGRLDEMPARIEAATVEDVNRALRAHLRPGDLSIAVVGDLKAAGLR
ncbi:MAG TPA: pitrilysin family protein [Planctomycetota bacterium]|nr:pitrilysin family protein [Planctomycetota bacterium]